MKLDTRRPFLVLLGAWNPAIFHPNWAALHLFGYEEGTTIQFTVVQQTEHPPMQITYIDKLGYSATNTRFNIYLQSYTNATFSSACDVVNKLIKTLPHTPFGDFGVNLHFFEDDPPDALYDSLQSTDNLNHHFKVISQEFNARIAYRDGCELNFKRIPTERLVVFDFNYHHSLTGITSLEKSQSAYLASLLSESLVTLETIYGITGYEEVAHDFKGVQLEGE